MLREFRADEVWGQAVVRQLKVVRDPRAIDPLMECFSSPVYEVANAAAGAMRRFGADAIPPLIAALSTTDQSVLLPCEHGTPLDWRSRRPGAARRIAPCGG